MKELQEKEERWWETSWDRVKHYCLPTIDEYLWYALTQEQADLIYYLAGDMSRQEFYDKYVNIDEEDTDEAVPLLQAKEMVTDDNDPLPF